MKFAPSEDHHVVSVTIIGESFRGAMVLSLEAEGLLMQSDLAAQHLGNRDCFAHLSNHDTMTVGDLMRRAAK